MDIREILNYQIEALRELEELLDFEKDILIRDKAVEIPGIVEKKKVIAQKLSLLEKKRISLSGSRKADELSAEGMIEMEQVEALVKLADAIKEKEDTNYILTKQSINYIRLITSALNPGQKVVTYGSSGKAQDNTSAGLFTTKA